MVLVYDDDAKPEYVSGPALFCPAALLCALQFNGTNANLTVILSTIYRDRSAVCGADESGLQMTLLRWCRKEIK
jgi:hypothetical protein